MLYFIKKQLRNNYSSRDLYLLLLIGGLYSIGLFLSNTFVNIYLWRQTEDFLTIATYHLAIVISKPITFIIAGKITKKIDRVIVLRLGVIFLSLFFLTVLILQEKAAYFNVLLGTLIGIGYGFYWLAFNVLTFEITEPYNRVFFNGILGSLQSISGMIGPLLAGTIILHMETNIGYMTIFSLSFILFIMAVVLSFFIKRRETDGMYRLQLTVNEIKRNRDWKYTLLANFFQGIRDGVFIFVISIWIFITTRSEFSLGIFSLVLNGSSFIIFLLLTIFIKDSIRIKLIFIGAIFMSFAIWIVIFDTTFMLLIVYAFVIGISFPTITVPFQSVTYDVIGKAHQAKDLRIEYIVLLEVISNLGSILSISLFIFGITFFTTHDPIPIMLVVFSLSYLAVYVVTKKVSLLYN